MVLRANCRRRRQERHEHQEEEVEPQHDWIGTLQIGEDPHVTAPEQADQDKGDEVRPRGYGVQILQDRLVINGFSGWRRTQLQRQDCDRDGDYSIGQDLNSIGITAIA